MTTLKRLAVLLFFIALVFPVTVHAAQINLEVKEFFLDNGMQFLIVERPVAPQVACRLAIRAGSALEDSGKTGIAHLLEHMLFKGTKNFGTLDNDRDQALQNRIENAYQKILAEERKRKPNQNIIQKQYEEMHRLRQEVKKIYVPQAFSSQLNRNGAIGVNAFTTKDQTQFVVSIPSDMLEQWFSIASEQIFEPSWREFYVEKEVVQREWAYRYVNNPSGAAWLDLNATAYQAHPYRNPTIGWRSDMKLFNATDAMQFHATYYNPANAVCVLVGDITVAEAKKLANIYFSRYPRGLRTPERLTQEPPQQGPRQNIRFLKGARTPLVYLGYHAAQMGSDDFYTLDALVMILNYGLNARLTQQVVNKGLALSAWAYNPDNRYGGMFIFGGSPNEPDGINAKTEEQVKRDKFQKACESFESIIFKQVALLKNELVKPHELARIKKLIQRDHLERMRSNESLADFLSTLEVQVGWRYMQNYLEKISAVTPEDIQRVARKYFRRENQTSIFLIPGGQPEKPPEQYTESRSVSGAAASQTKRTAQRKNNSRYPTPPGWKHPLSFDRHPEKIIYPPAQQFAIGDTPVFFIADHELPIIEMTLLCKAGSVDLAENQNGLTQLLNYCLISGGTQKYAPDELAQILDENAIRIAFEAGEEETAIHLSVMRQDWKKGLELLAEILLHPRFDQQILNVTKQQAVMALKREGEDAQTVSAREKEIWQFKGHPYGLDPLKGIITIPQLTSDDLVNFLKNYVKASNLIVTIAGDIEKKQIETTLNPFLAQLPPGPAPQRTLSPPEPTPPVLALIHKPGQVQSQISLALPSIRRTHPDFWKLRLLSDIFGGSDSMLYVRLRDDLGLVYSAYFYQAYKWEAGYFAGYIGCKGDKTDQSIRETVLLMQSLHNGIPEEMFQQKKLDTLNSFVFNVDSPFELVDVYGRYKMRGEPLDTLDLIQETYIHAQKAELTRLSKKWLDPSKLQIFVVGDKMTRISMANGQTRTLEEALKALADELQLPYREIPLR